MWAPSDLWKRANQALATVQIRSKWRWEPCQACGREQTRLLLQSKSEGHGDRSPVRPVEESKPGSCYSPNQKEMAMGALSDLWKRAKQAPATDQIRRKWRWVGHTLPYSQSSVTRLPLDWILPRGRGRDRRRWRTTVESLCFTRSTED